MHMEEVEFHEKVELTVDQIVDGIRKELAFLWAAHDAVGLKGYMCLYTEEVQTVWRAKQNGIKIWFTPDDTETIIEAFKEHYNKGNLPNSPFLLNPVIHQKIDEETYKPLGSGFAWATGLTLGIAKMSPDMDERMQTYGILHNRFDRGDEGNAGLKMIALSQTILPPNPDGRTVLACRDLYELSNIHSEYYAPFYLLSCVEYLCAHGLFSHPGIDQLIPADEREQAPSEIVARHQLVIKNVLDANYCWNSYDRLHSLFMRFGSDPADVERNNRFYNLCARDIELFDRTGATRKEGSDEQFEFIVQGLIPRGAVTLIAAPGGTGKSSTAHLLAVLAAIDWRADEPNPTWLGQKINLEYCKGISIYFSGEDGPPIVNARAEMFDPEKRSQRLQLHRTEFMDKDQTFGQYLSNLRKMPDVPLVVIDPARKYLTGDEDDAEVVSEFFEAIDEFAIRKKSAVVVVHHLQKGAKPQSAMDCLDMLRGSQVFIDRPRVVIGMCRSGPNVRIGLAKNNIPPNLGMVTEERVFGRNAKTLTLVQLPGEAGIIRSTLTQEQLEELEEQKAAEEEQKAAEAEANKAGS